MSQSSPVGGHSATGRLPRFFGVGTAPASAVIAAPTRPELLEREREQAAVAQAIASAAAGAGRVLVVEGQAGIGKTELLRLARGRGAAEGMQVIVARAGPLEGEFPFGVVRQLFEPALRGLSYWDRERLLAGAAAAAAPVIGVSVPLADPARLDLMRALHGLYWLCSNLAERGPILAAIDDAHTADAESLRWLAYMANRVDDLPIVLAAGARSGEEPTDAASLAAIGAAPAATVLRPAPLSERASARLVRALCGEDAAPEFCRACHAATGGNPFYLRELVLETKRQGIPPAAAQAERVGRLGPRAVSTATVARLARLPPSCAALARAVTILGLDAELHHAAALAGIAMEDAEDAADALADGGIVEPQRPLNFIHPVVGAAIHAEMPAGERSQAHARAAELLEREGADAGVVASHLLLVDPAGSATVRERLERAAAEALQRGAPATAATYLRRAVTEATEAGARAELLARLGHSELLAGDQAAVDHLVEASELASEPDLMVEAAITLSSALSFMARFEEADERLRRTIARLDASADQAAVWRLEAVRLQLTAFDARFNTAVDRRLPALLARAPQAGAAGRVVFIVGALRAAIRGERHDEVPAMIERGLGGGRLIAEETADSLAAGMAVNALQFFDYLDTADEVLEALFADARARGSVLAYVGALIWRGWGARRRGLVGAAEADERAAVELSEEHGLRFPLPWAQAFLADALVERGEIAAAGEVADALEPYEEWMDSLAGQAFDVRGRVRLAQGRREEGIADLALSGERHEAIGVRNPNLTHWRSSLALALGRESPEARKLVETELARAREAQCSRAVGVALRAHGILDATEDGIAMLREAVAVLEATPARLEHARAVASLGAALRRDGHRVEARQPLRHALDIADRLGAGRVAEEARAELAAAGARPRRRRLSGPESLTPMEHRVAEMAAEGMSNREIAQALFVSRKTVEMHLGHAYRKLDIHSRGELPAALRGASRT
jgi:DNA-binding CsgD family transcriptional regulator